MSRTLIITCGCVLIAFATLVYASMYYASRTPLKPIYPVIAMSTPEEVLRACCSDTRVSSGYSDYMKFAERNQ